MIDNIPPEVGLPLAAILWIAVAYPFARRVIIGKREKR